LFILEPVAAEAFDMLHVIEFSHDLELQRIIMEGAAAQIVLITKLE
jgi:hypothetical protein